MVKCAYCNVELAITSSHTDYSHELELQVEPCEKCLETAEEEGKRIAEREAQDSGE